jgi:endonuclease/exonuclease/phosphatase family metal-dependent hydrolase
VTLFGATAERYGYQSFATSRAHHTDGLAVYLKNSLVAAERPVLSAVSFATQVLTEYFPGPKMKRGYEQISFVQAQLGTIHIFNTHMTAFPQNWRKRMSQARQLGLAIRSAGDDDSSLVLLGGDLNGGPFYPEDVFRSPTGRQVPGWWCNTLSYFLVLYYGGLTDLAVVGAKAADADIEAFAQSPRAPATWPFTVDETTNSLYAEQYAGTEYPARIDHVLGRPLARLAVEQTQLVFGQKREFGHGAFGELSDHYGVSVLVKVPSRTPSAGF